MAPVLQLNLQFRLNQKTTDGNSISQSDASLLLKLCSNLRLVSGAQDYELFVAEKFSSILNISGYLDDGHPIDHPLMESAWYITRVSIVY